MRGLEFSRGSTGSSGFPQSGGIKCAPNPTFHTRRGRQKTTHKNKQEQINNEQASQPEQTSLQARGKNSKPASQPARTNKKQQATHNKQQTTHILQHPPQDEAGGRRRVRCDYSRSPNRSGFLLSRPDLLGTWSVSGSMILSDGPRMASGD